MSKVRDFMNKAIVGAGLVGTLYMNGCKQGPITPLEKDVVTIKRDTNNIVTFAHTGDIFLESEAVRWNNAKLIGKDIGFVLYDAGDEGFDYAYGEYLFRSPDGEEVALFGKEDVFFVGQNYDIEFFRLKSGQDRLSSKEIMEALGKQSFGSIEFETYVHGLEGVLNKYTRVKKSGDNNE